MANQKPQGLGKGHKCTISGDPQDMGLNHRSGIDNKKKPYPRGETSTMEQRPTRPGMSLDSDRGTFKCK